MLEGKKTYIFSALTVAAAAWLLYAGALSTEVAIPTIAGALIAIGFRSALASSLAKLLAALIEQPRSAGPRQPEDGEIRRL